MLSEINNHRFLIGYTVAIEILFDFAYIWAFSMYFSLLLSFSFSFWSTLINCFISVSKVINLVGPASQQDVEMSALFHDAVIAYGEGKVLGILATKTSDHEIRKRAAVDDASTTTTPIPFIEPDIPDEMKREDFIYYPADQTYKILLHTHSPPRLINGSSVTVLSDTKMTITTNRRNQNSQTLKVRYNSKPGVRYCYFFTIIFFTVFDRTFRK